MFTREALWRQVAGPQAWPLAWGLAAACGVPWLIPETWDGQFPAWGPWLGWGLALAALPLLRTRAAALGWALPLAWVTLLGLAREARADRTLPVGLVELEGRIAAPWMQRGRTVTSSMNVTSPHPLAGLDLPLRVPASDTPLPPPGVPVRLRAELAPVPPGPAFLGERPRWRALDRGEPRRIQLRSALQLEALGPPEPGLLLRFRLHVLKRFQDLPLDPVARDLWGALALGLNPAQEDVFTVFAESGTIHVLVVSGLQVTLVGAVLEGLLRRLLRRDATLGAAAGTLLYALLVGFSAPVWRGLVMALAWLLGRSRGWVLPPALGLHGALFLWWLAHPAAGCDPGFLLAWAALLSLVWGSGPLADLWRPLLGRLSAPLASLVAPWAATLPLLALLHGGAPLHGIVANALILPLVTVLTPVCLLWLALPWQAPAAWIGHLLTFVGTRIVPAFAAIRPLAVAHALPWVALTLGWLALAQASAGLKRTRGWALGLVALTFGLLARGGLDRSPDTLSMEAVDVGDGDALLVQVPGGPTTLVDVGPGPWAARRLARVLSRRGVRGPVQVILTHPHADHAGAWATLARLWPLEAPQGPVLGASGSRWFPLLGSVPPQPLRRGMSWGEGPVQWSVRWPRMAMDLPDPNMASLVLRLDMGPHQLWLMGDALDLQEGDLLDLGDPGASPGHRLLKPGHHGGARTCAAPWIGALHPDLALVTAGREGRFDFPHPRTRQTLGTAGCVLRETGREGGLRVLARPGGWSVQDGAGRWTWVGSVTGSPGPFTDAGPPLVEEPLPGVEGPP